METTLGCFSFSGEQVCVSVRPKPCSARQTHPVGLINHLKFKVYENDKKSK